MRSKQHRSWSKKDLKILKKLHPTEKFPVIAEKLGRSAHAVKAMAIKLGLRKQKASVPWSKQEEADFIQQVVSDYGVVCRGLNDDLPLDEQVAVMYALKQRLEGQD